MPSTGQRCRSSTGQRRKVKSSERPELAIKSVVVGGWYDVKASMCFWSRTAAMPRWVASVSMAVSRIGLNMFNILLPLNKFLIVSKPAWSSSFQMNLTFFLSNAQMAHTNYWNMVWIYCKMYNFFFLTFESKGPLRWPGLSVHKAVYPPF